MAVVMVVIVMMVVIVIMVMMVMIMMMVVFPVVVLGQGNDLAAFQVGESRLLVIGATAGEAHD
jgi:hypothetical protein